MPGPLPRIQSQLALAAACSDGGIVGFSVPEYMTPLGGAGAQELLANYRAAILPNGGKAVK